MSLGVVDLLFTGLYVPLAPRGNYRHIGGESLYCQFETHLVVAFSGAAVADGVCTLGFCDLDDALCDDGAGKGGAEHIFLVERACLDGGDDVVIDEIVGEVLDVQL